MKILVTEKGLLGFAALRGRGTGSCRTPRTPSIGIVEPRGRLVFLLLILAQCGHLIEEYGTKLYEVYAPARFVSSLVSNDLAVGFLVVNAPLVLFGLWCWAVPVRSGWRAARGFVWFWIILELGNGIGHLWLAWSQGGYFPGAVTAPVLLGLAAWMAVLQVKRGDG